MFPGQWLIADKDTLTIWSPWFPRGAESAIFTFEQMVKKGSGTFTVDVYHKNKEDKGDGASAGATFTQVGSTTFWSSDHVAPLKELVRFQYYLNDASATTNVLFRMLAPTWVVPATT